MGQLIQFKILTDIVCGTDHSFKFLESGLDIAAASFLRVRSLITLKGKITDDRGEEKLQDSRSLRRHGIPGTQPGIAHAFFAVRHIMQDPVSDAQTVSSVFIVRLPDRILISFPVQFNDFPVFHGSPFTL